MRKATISCCSMMLIISIFALLFVGVIATPKMDKKALDKFLNELDKQLEKDSLKN
nr:venom peptide [Acharia stimulea]